MNVLSFFFLKFNRDFNFLLLILLENYYIILKKYSNLDLFIFNKLTPTRIKNS